MARPIYSAIMVAPMHLDGHSAAVIVPDNHQYVVKQLVAYATPILGQTTVHFQDSITGVTLWSAFFTADAGGWQGFYGHLVFPAGSSFNFFVNSADGNTADVAAYGYDLLGTP